MVAAIAVPALGAGKAKVELTVVEHGPGLVNASPGGISCGAKCSAKVARGAIVKLTAHTVDGSTFDGWSGACTGDDPRCTLVLDASATAKARFTPALIDVEVVVGGTGRVVSTPAGLSCGSGSSACRTVFAKRSHVHLRAEPTGSSVFVGWQGACSGTAPCTVTPVDALSLRAVFRRAYAVSASGTGPGTIESSLWPGCSLPCSAVSSSASTVTLNAVPDGGQPFARWTGACAGVVPRCVLATDAATSVSASFGIFTLLPPGTGPTLSVTSAGPGAVVGGGLSCGPVCLVRPGPSTTITAKAAAGAAFVGWGGDCSGTPPTCTLAMTSARSVTATFRHLYTLKVAGGVRVAPFGTPCPTTCTIAVPSDQLVTLTAIQPALGPDVTTAVDWRPACAGPGNVCTFAVDAPTTIAVKKSAVAPLTSTSYGLIVSIAAKGTVTGTKGFSCVRKAGPKACSQSYHRGDHVTLQAKPKARFRAWTGSCSGKQPTCSLTMDGTKVVIARFKP